MIYSLPNANASIIIDNNNIIFKFNDWTHGDIKELYSFLVHHFNKPQVIKTSILDVENISKKNIKIHNDDLEYTQKISEILYLAGREHLIIVPCSRSNLSKCFIRSAKESGLKHILCTPSIDKAKEIGNLFKAPDYFNSPEY